MTLNWAMNPMPRRNRKPAVLHLWAGAVMCAMTLALVGCGTSDDTAPQGFVGEAGDAAPTVAEDLTSFLGEVCEADNLVMTQGSENNYCDKDAAGSLVWVDQAAHDESEALAQAAAEKEALEARAAELIAAKELAVKEAAEAKALEEADAAAEAAKAAELAAVQDAAEKKEREAAAAKAKQETAELSKPAPLVSNEKADSSVFYQNCTEVRAAGAAPIYQGDPGYSTKLDRDRDGVGCE